MAPTILFMLLIYQVVTLEAVISMKITSNVITYTPGETYSVTCTSGHHTVDFYKNGQNITRTNRRSVDSVCKSTYTDYTCNMTYDDSKHLGIHTLIIPSTQQEKGSNITWQCRYRTAKSNNISITNKGNVVSTETKKNGEKITDAGSNNSAGDGGDNGTGGEGTGGNTGGISLIYVVIGAGGLLCLFVISAAVYLTSRHRRKAKEEAKAVAADAPMIIDTNLLYQNVDATMPVLSADYDAVDDRFECKSEDKNKTCDCDADKLYGVVDKNRSGTTTFNKDPTPDVINVGNQTLIYAEVQRKQ